MKIRKKHFSITAFALALTAPCYGAISQTILGGTIGAAGVINGIALSHDASKLYATSAADNRLLILNATTGSPIAFYGILNGINVPDDVVVKANGDLFVTDIIPGFVVKFPANPTTGIPDPFTVATKLPSPPANPALLPLVNSLVLSEDETHLYAGICSNPYTPNYIYDFDLNANTVDVVKGPDNQPLSFGIGCSINGMAYKDGFLYGPHVIDGTIYRVGPLDQPGISPQSYVVVAGGGADSQVQCPGSTPALINPGSVEFDSQGRLYITDAYTNKLSRVTKPNKVCQTPVEIATMPGGFGLPGNGIDSLAIDKATDRILVSNSAEGYIAQVNVDKSTGTIGGYLKTGSLVLPLPVVLHADGNIYLGDYNSLRTIDKATQTVTNSVAESFAGFLGGSTDPLSPTPTGVNSPFSLASFGNNVVIGNFLDRFIQIWNPNGPNGGSVVENISARNLGFHPPVPPSDPGFSYGTPLNVIEYIQPGDTESSVLAAQLASGTAPDGSPDPVTTNPRSYLIKYSNSAAHYTQVTRLGNGIPGFANGYPEVFTGLATNGTTYWVASRSLAGLFGVPGSNTGKIYTFNNSGPNIAAPLLSNLVNPLGLAYYSNHLYVIELGNTHLGGTVAPSLSSINLANNVKTVIESPIPVGSFSPLVSTRGISGVAADTNGDLYYTGEACLPFGTGACTKVLNKIPRCAVNAIETGQPIPAGCLS